tara:strand:+ start:8993 stop:9934 length:942 start_codon:yes stop_codon:yes gene_type:complete
MKLLLPITTLLATASAATIRTTYQFDNSTWLENLALTRNGSLLVTVIGRPEVHIVNPLVTPATASLVHTFPNANAVLGITEVKHDVFAVAVGTTTPANAPIEGSFSIWSIDISDCRHAATIQKVADLNTVSMVNGITLLNPHTLLLADSWAGNIVALDLRSRAYNVLLRDASLASNFSNTALPLGVNGVRLHAPTAYLYYSNTVLNLLGRVKLDTRTGVAVAPFEIITTGEQIGQPDDFAVLADGSVVLAHPVADAVEWVGRDGVVRGLGMVSGVTSVVTAEGGKGKGKMYMSTSTLEGGQAVGRGKVVEIEV